MPGRALQRQASRFDQTVMGQVDDLMKIEQRTQTARTTLKTQQLLRNIDQQIMTEMNEQFARYDANEVITDDLLDTDTRVTRMRQLYDEGMQNIRQGVSMPGAQLELETRAEDMWQQYQHSWEDKAKAMQRAWDRNVLGDDVQGFADIATKDDVHVWAGMARESIRDAARSGTIDPHEIHGMEQAAHASIFDTVARRFINQPHDDEQKPLENFNEAHDESLTLINSFKESGDITEAHRQELEEYAGKVREQRQEQLYQELEDQMTHITRDKGSQLYMNNPLNVRLDYLIESQDLFAAFDDELSMLTENQRKEYATRLYTEIGRINRSLDDATSGSRIDAITASYINPIMEMAERDPAAAMLMMDPDNQDGMLVKLRREVGERMWGEISEVVQERVVKVYDRLREEFNTQRQAPFHGNETTTRAFNELMEDYNLSHDSETAYHFRQMLLGATGNTDGTADKITVDQIREFRKYLDDQATVGELSRRGTLPLTNWTNPLSQSVVGKMAAQGVQIPEVFQSLHTLGASDADLTYTAEMMGRMSEAIRGHFSSGRNAAFTIADVNTVVSDTLGGLDRSELDDDSPVAYLYDSLIASVATLTEASDMAGKVLMGTVDGADHYNIDNIELQEGTLNPVFTVSYVNDAGNHISRRYSTEATSGEMGKLIRWGMVRDRSTNQIVMRNGQPIWRQEAVYDMDDIKRIHESIGGAGTSSRTPPPTDYTDPGQAMGLTY